jgi:dUTPase
MKLYIKDVPGLMLPKQANQDDAAFDITAFREGMIVGKKISHPMDNMELWESVEYIEYRTNLFYKPGENPKNILETYHTELFPRSSLSKYNMILCNSVATIDNGYRGEVLLRFKYYFQPEDFVCIPIAGINRIFGIVNKDKIYNQGDKIVQLKMRKDIPIEIHKISELPSSTRNIGGFGSSGK